MTKFICLSGKAQNGKDTAAELLKEKLLSKGCKVVITHYADLLKYICKNYFEWNGAKDLYGRTLLQLVGTDIVRKQNPDFWVNFVIDIVKFFPTEWDYVIVPDTRFPNEIKRLKDEGFPVTYIKVIRDGFDNGLSEAQKNHLSETALDDLSPDFIIHNDGSLGLLEERVISLMKNLFNEDNK